MKILKPIIAFSALLFTIAFISPLKSQPKKETPFNIMTYNIRMNTPNDGVNAWPLRKDRVIGLLRFHQADLFGVQEALPEQVRDLEQGMPEFAHVGVGRDDGKSQGEHMLIFYRTSRFEKLADGNFWLSPTPDKPGLGWDAACNRTCTWIKLRDKITKKVFYHFNTHLDHMGKVAREESPKLILKNMAEINKENLPLILTGDFNAVKKSVPIQIILKVLSDSREKCQVPPYGPEGTSGGFDVKLMPHIIDYIFINEKVMVLRHGIITDSIGLFYPSDHLPVLAEIRLN